MEYNVLDEHTTLPPWLALGCLVVLYCCVSAEISDRLIVGRALRF